LTLADMEKLYEVLTALDLDDDADLAASDVDNDTDMGANTGEYNLADHEPLFYARGWEWTVWADGGLRCNVLIPRTDLSWMESRLHIGDGSAQPGGLSSQRRRGELRRPRGRRTNPRRFRGC
jgi:hypothetical protein